MSLSGSDDNSEVERREKPPSSYGSMRSDEDDEDLDEQREPACKVITQWPSDSDGPRVHRSSSPQTVFTERSQGHQSVVAKEGIFLIKANPPREPVYVKPKAGEEEEEEVEEEEEEMDEEEVYAETSLSETEPVVSIPPPKGAGLQSGFLHCTLSVPHIFKSMLGTLSQLSQGELRMFKRFLCSRHKTNFKSDELEDSDSLDLVDRLLERLGKGEALQTTIRALQHISKEEMANALGNDCRRAIVHHELKLNRKRRCSSIYEGVARAGRQVHINNVYTEPPIIIGGDREMNMEHEVRRPDVAVSKQGIPIMPNDIFRADSPENGTVRNVLMTGLPGIGLTVAVQKFIIDWADEVANQDLQFVFSFLSRDLTVMGNEEQSMLELLSTFYLETRDINFLDNADCSCLFIIESLEMYNLPLDFLNNPAVTDIHTPATVDALFTSLIRGSLLPHARVWITSHRTESLRIPPSCIHRTVEVKGFTDEQKDDYFMKRASGLGSRILAHVKRSRTLYMICHLPLFSWIVSYMYELSFRRYPDYGSDPPGITGFYTQYVIVQTNRRIERYVGTGIGAQRWTEQDKNFLWKLGKMALGLLEAGREVIHEEDLTEAGLLDLTEVASRCGLVTEVMRTEGYGGKRAFSFIHFTFQEFMAALYVYLAFRNDGENVLKPHNRHVKRVFKQVSDPPMMVLFKPAVDRALQSSTGHLDLFLRYLFGLVCHATEQHLRGLLIPQYPSAVCGMEEVVKYVQKRMSEDESSERSRNLELCLDELKEGRKRD